MKPIHTKRILFFAWASAMVLLCTMARGQESLTARDKSIIKSEARNLIEHQLVDLYNSVASDAFGKAEIDLIIANSFIPNVNQLFELTAYVEDDINPDNLKKKDGHAERRVKQYLDDFNLFYKKDNPGSVKITGLEVGDVQQGKDFYFLQAHFFVHFTNSHRTKTTPYQPVYRTAEIKAEKEDNKWRVLITSLKYFREPAPVVKPADKVAPPTVAREKKDPPAASKEPVPKPAAIPNKAEEKPLATSSAPKTATPLTTPVAEMKPNESENQVAVTGAAPKTPVVTPTETRVQEDQKSGAAIRPDASLQALEAQMRKHKQRTTLYRAAAGAGVAGAGAAFVIVNGKYGSYKSQIETTNQEFRRWYAENLNSEVPESDLAKPQSLFSFGAPGVYLVGAGVLAGGALWLLSTKSNKQYRSVRGELEQRRRSLSVSPQASPAHRYAGVSLHYRF